MSWLLLALLQASPLERWLGGEDAARREIRGTVEEVEAELRAVPPRPPVEERGTLVRRTLKADHPAGGEFKTVLWVPADYTPERSWRLLVDLHGQNGTGEGALGRWLEDLKADGETFLLCPTAGPGAWGRSLLGHAYVFTAIRDVMARYAIDPDLVFLDGASMGGNGSFQLVVSYPDRFAGAMPRSGGPLFRYVKARDGSKTVTAEGVENLVATPLYWIVGGKDREVPLDWVKAAHARIEPLKSDYTFRLFPEGGHEWFPGENAAVLAWMKERRRNAWPGRVNVVTNEQRFNRNFWLEITAFRETRSFPRSFIGPGGKTIEQRPILLKWARAEAELDREKNEIRITAEGVRSLRVYLHGKMVDFSKPVIVRANRGRRSFRVKPDLDTLLESARRDRGLLYTASVKVSVR